MFSLLINGEEKGNMLLLICVNLGTHTQPAAVRMRLGISSAVNQTHFTPRRSSSLRRKQELGFRRKAGCRAELAGWLRATALPASLEEDPSPSRASLDGDSHLDGAAGSTARLEHWGHRARSCLCRGDTHSQCHWAWGIHIQAQRGRRMDASSLCWLNTGWCFHLRK